MDDFLLSLLVTMSLEDDKYDNVIVDLLNDRASREDDDDTEEEEEEDV